MLKMPNQISEAPQLGRLNVDELQFYSMTAPPLLFSLPVRESPVTLSWETHFSHLYLQSHSFPHELHFMTIDELWNINWPVNWGSCLSAQLSVSHHRPVQSLQNCRCWPIDLQHHSSFTHLKPFFLTEVHVGKIHFLCPLKLCLQKKSYALTEIVFLFLFFLA